ncbi:hypothetical protein JCM17380_25610 [Desulfosporosinus burensis]
MKMRINGAVVFNIFLVLVFAAVIIVSLGYSYRARLTPLVIGIPGLLVTVITLVFELRKSMIKQDPSAVDQSAAATEKSKNKEKVRKEIIAFSWLTGLFLLIYVVGFIIAIPIYLFLYLKIKSQEKLVFSGLFSLISWGALYGFFGLILHIPLYPGIIVDKFF